MRMASPVGRRPCFIAGATLGIAVAVLVGCQPPTEPQFAPSMDNATTLVEAYRVGGLDDRRFNHETFWRVVEPYLAAFTVEEIGRSVEGRSIRAIRFGSGETSVLLWSQMHGDESTATMALADLLSYLSQAVSDPLRRMLSEKLTLTFVPMLNPDGAESFRRHNVLGVDINRDARRLASPEARALKQLRDSLEPDFGFNLHDQAARTLAGEKGQQVGVALLAPAHDDSRAYNAVRSRARLVASVLAGAVGEVIPGRVAKYDDTFEPRAFGDNMQAWGASTVLIESGALVGDFEKQQLRGLNAAALLVALESIASASYRSADPDVYESLPPNERIAHDIIVRGAEVVVGDETFRLDVGLVFDDSVERVGPRLGEVGDMSHTEAIEVVDADSRFVHVELVGESGGGRRLIRGEPVVVRITAGRAADSELVREIR